VRWHWRSSCGWSCLVAVTQSLCHRAVGVDTIDSVGAIISHQILATSNHSYGIPSHPTFHPSIYTTITYSKHLSIKPNIHQYIQSIIP